MDTNFPVRKAEDQAALRAYWKVYEPVAAEVSDEVRRACEGIPEFADIVRAMPADEVARQDEKSRRHQREALLEGRWDGFLADLAEQGANYAKMGISFGAWFEVVAVFRHLVRPHLARLAATDLTLATAAGDGLNHFMDIAMASIGEAYLRTKEDIIRDQQDAIREISTPVLQIRDQVLILPIVGLVDTHRARLLTESLLKAIRTRRARAVVMDVTGVPLVDSKVAKHLAQTCEAARLMGATVIMTGISQEIAQTLVTIGADLAGVRTLGDLQSGIEAIDREMFRGGIEGTRT